jgi:hypothetical protein
MVECSKVQHCSLFTKPASCVHAGNFGELRRQLMEAGSWQQRQQEGLGDPSLEQLSSSRQDASPSGPERYGRRAENGLLILTKVYTRPFDV